MCFQKRRIEKGIDTNGDRLAIMFNIFWKTSPSIMKKPKIKQENEKVGYISEIITFFI